MSDESKKVSPEQPKDKVEDVKDLNEKPISDSDAQGVKGGLSLNYSKIEFK
jgi:hypothetical protein